MIAGNGFSLRSSAVCGGLRHQPLCYTFLFSRFIVRLSASPAPAWEANVLEAPPLGMSPRSGEAEPRAQCVSRQEPGNEMDQDAANN